MTMVTPSGRSRWPYLIGALILVAIIGGTIAYTATRPNPTPTATPTAAPTSSLPSPSPATTDSATSTGNGENDVAPTGCLGGQDRTATMVLTAQTKAKHTTYGAVEVATAYFRFIWQNPQPAAVETDEIASKIIAPDAPDGWKNVTGQYETDAWKALLADDMNGSSFHLSSTNGVWRVAEESTPDRVNIDLALGYVIDGSLSPTRTSSLGMVMVWLNDGWHIQTGLNVDQTKLTAGGTRYTGGC